MIIALTPLLVTSPYQLTKATRDFNRAKELGRLLNEGLKDRMTRYQDLRDNVVATSCNVFHKIMVRMGRGGEEQKEGGGREELKEGRGGGPLGLGSKAFKSALQDTRT